jgi:hypothetical protein
MPSNSQTQSDPAAKSETPELNPQPGSPAKNFPPPRPLSGEVKPGTSQAQRSGQNPSQARNQQEQQKRDQAKNQRNPEHPEKPAPAHDDDEIDVDRELTTPPARTTKDESI